MFAIIPHIYWNKSGVIYNSYKGTFSGTKQSIFKFLKFLNNHNLLIKDDLRY